MYMRSPPIFENVVENKLVYYYASDLFIKYLDMRRLTVLLFNLKSCMPWKISKRHFYTVTP